MKPITFTCETTLPQKPEKIASQILDLSKWHGFNGYGPLPGIKLAEFETRNAEIVGTRIRVTNRDGSTHVEEIVEWDPARRLRLHMHEFSPPVSRPAGVSGIVAVEPSTSNTRRPCLGHSGGDSASRPVYSFSNTT